MTLHLSLREATAQVSGFRTARPCAGCGEKAGSISAGTGRPLVLDKESGHFFHLSCKPGAVGIGAALAGLSGLGA